jgi:hypothetical protein
MNKIVSGRVALSGIGGFSLLRMDVTSYSHHGVT